MAVVYTDAAKANYGPDAVDGSVKCRRGQYTFDGDGAANINDEILIVPIPSGAQIIDIKLQANSGCPTLDVGYYYSSSSKDVDYFMDGVDASSGILTNMISTESSVFAGLFYEFTSDGFIVVVPTVANCASHDTITVVVLYKMEGGISDET